MNSANGMTDKLVDVVEDRPRFSPPRARRLWRHQEETAVVVETAASGSRTWHVCLSTGPLVATEQLRM